MTTVEINLAGDSLIHFRREAIRRNLPSPAWSITSSTRSAADGLTTAILDD
jgi:hypothetical protein